MNEIRKRLIEILSGMADEPAQTFDNLEGYIRNLLLQAKIDTLQEQNEKLKEILNQLNEAKI